MNNTYENSRYKKNLKQLYIVHPTVWIKMTFRLFKPFLSNKFWKKLIYIEQTAGIQVMQKFETVFFFFLIVKDIWKYFQKDQIKLPDSVLKYITFLHIFGDY